MLLDTVQYGIPSNLIFDENTGLPHGNEVLYDAAKKHRITNKIFIEWPRQVGKTTSLGILGACLCALPHRFRTLNGEQLETISLGFYAPIEDKAKKLMDEVRRNYGTSALRTLLPKKRDSLFQDNQLHLVLTNFCEVVAYNSSARSVRGGSHHIGAIDETAQINETFYETCIEATAYEIGHRLVYSGTAETTYTYQYKLKDRARKNSYRVCQKCGNEWDLGAYERKHTWDYDPVNRRLFKVGMREEYCSKCGAIHDDEHFTFTGIVPICVNPWIRISKPPHYVWELLMEWDNDPLIRQELLCEEVLAGNLMFPYAHLIGAYREEGCYAPWLKNGNSQPYERKVIGIDLGKHRDHTAIVILHQDEDGSLVIDYVRRWPLKVDYHQVRKELVSIIRKFKVTEVVIDTFNAGESVGDEMNHDLDGEVKFYSEDNKLGFRATPKKKEDILQNLQLRIVNHEMQIPDKSDPDVSHLIHELKTFSYKKIEETGKVKFGVQSENDDIVLALAMAAKPFRRAAYIPVKPRVINRAGKEAYSPEESFLTSQRRRLHQKPYISCYRFPHS